MAANGVRIFGVDPLDENLLHVSCTLIYVKKLAEITAFNDGNYNTFYLKHQHTY